jgi:hypothetical protein
MATCGGLEANTGDIDNDNAEMSNKTKDPG